MRTNKQRRFIEEYLIDLNATQAAIRAGYGAKSAYSVGQRLLKDVEIQMAVKDAQETLKERIHVTVDQIMGGLLTEARNTLEGSSHSARVSAWAHLGKHLGMFVEKTENVNHNYTISDEPMSQDDWANKYVGVNGS